MPDMNDCIFAVRFHNLAHWLQQLLLVYVYRVSIHKCITLYISYTLVIHQLCKSKFQHQEEMYKSETLLD